MRETCEDSRESNGQHKPVASWPVVNGNFVPVRLSVVRHHDHGPLRIIEDNWGNPPPTGAREIAALVRNGTKTASGDLVWSIEADGKLGSRPGDLWIV